MKPLHLLVAIVHTAIFSFSSVAFAGVGDKVPNHIYSVPGVLQTASLVTVFQCTNSMVTGFGVITWTVEVFDAAGQPAGSASFTLPGGATGIISTGPVATLTPDATMNVANGTEGSARIIGGKPLLCTAYVMSPNPVPGYMNALPVFSKIKQKGD